MNLKDLSSSSAFMLSTVVYENTEQHIVKLNQFMNLMKSCDIVISIEDVLPLPNKLNDFDLIFIDCFTHNKGQRITDEILQLALNNRVVLFNCEHDVYCEKLSLLAGIQGIFYLDERADIILKGLEKIRKNERWFRRAVMDLALAELLKARTAGLLNNRISNSSGISVASLTKREKTIIEFISSGAQNKEIAAQLHISPNTVKTHIYSIFRKTSSRNRIELISWTQQNIQA